jgi:putative transposase
MRFEYIDSHRKDYDVYLMCQVMKVSRAGYYAWAARGPSGAAIRRLKLADAIRQVHEKSRRTYGSPRVHQALLRQGERCSRRLVEKLMKEQELRSKRHKRFRVRTTDSNHEHPVAKNLLDRQFDPGPPDRVWITDISYIPTAEGWLYLATVMDLGSRKIIGRCGADHMRSDLAQEALRQAIKSWRPGSVTLLHHSDRGVQFACREYRQVLELEGIRCSMSRSAECYDNAVMESFFKTLKSELTHHEQYGSRKEAMESIYEYIDCFYNVERLHSSLGYQTPVEYEAGFDKKKRTRRAY